MMKTARSRSSDSGMGVSPMHSSRSEHGRDAHATENARPLTISSVLMTATLLLGAMALAEQAVTKPAAPAAWAFHGGGALLGVAPQLPPPPMKPRWTYRCDEDGDAGIDGAA